ncbi:formin-like protein 3 [Canis lupus familiaris]|uniref:formin-like protein 3 n=1 Tax=Canis lupus familiaris TaxID=9615 RepID=UPI0015F18BCC|nr:formin-like protein 3 [Canis lupus familiaris]XP_038451754.1 formin-like protein 3 [Canis lupus familiaris]XP_038530586.1 formin-like protein 3 [Canis lupus familiaris]
MHLTLACPFSELSDLLPQQPRAQRSPPPPTSTSSQRSGGSGDSVKTDAPPLPQCELPTVPPAPPPRPSVGTGEKLPSEGPAVNSQSVKHVPRSMGTASPSKQPSNVAATVPVPTLQMQN